VREIRAVLATGATQGAISEQFGVSANVVSRIKRGETYKHVV
jgi:uncharacterized protein YerC